MTYSADISGLGADHHWKFDGNSTDSIGSVVATDNTMTYTGSPIAADATNSAIIDARSDRVSLASTTTIENGQHTRKAVAGWFSVDDKELPHCSIYGEGDYDNNFQFIIFAGNSLMFEARVPGSGVQIYSDVSLEANRAYHLCGIFEGSGTGNGNEVRFYLDGVQQTLAVPTNRQPDFLNLAVRPQVGVFGDPNHTTTGMGGKNFVSGIQAPGDNNSLNQIITTNYQHWCAWGDSVNAQLTDTDVRETLFERGALADITISTDTQANMQTALDVYSSTTRNNAPLCFEINAVSGGGDFELNLNTITFSSLASCHVRYNGTADTLTLRNKSSNCSIVSSPYGGSISLVTEVALSVTAQSASSSVAISGARCLVYADTGGSLPAQDSVTITRSGSTATVTHTGHGLITGDQAWIFGADQVEYDGIKTITVTGVNTYTYTVSGTPTTPATGTITSTAVIISDLTNGLGEVTANFDYSSDQPYQGRIRQGTSSTYFSEATFAGNITTNGLNTTILLVEDE